MKNIIVFISILVCTVTAFASEPHDSAVEVEEVAYKLKFVEQEIEGHKISVPLWLSPESESELFGIQTMSATSSSLIATRTALQWGGPEMRIRCIGYLKTKGLPTCRFEGIELYCKDTWIKTCSEWATDFKQHSYDIDMYGPPNMDPNQINQIKDACNISAITVQLFAIPFAVDTIVSLFTDTRPVMESMMRTCLQTTETLGRLHVKDFRLELVKRNFW